MYAGSGCGVTFFNKRMALKWPQWISTHQCTDVNYENHVFHCAQYMVLAYGTVHTPVCLVGQCLVLFDPDHLVRHYSSLEATLGSG
jgi:hypothetical protein